MGARTIRLFPHLKEFLMALGIFCDNGCTATFTKDKCHIYDITGRLILTGSRNRATNFLWHLDQCKNQTDFLTAQLNSITTGHSATPAERLAYAHATLSSPTISCLKTAVEKGFLPNIPGLTKAALRKYPPHTVATAKGHLDQTRKNKHFPSNRQNDDHPLLLPPKTTPPTHLACFSTCGTGANAPLRWI